MKKEKEDRESINLVTKVSAKQMGVIKSIVAELGFATPYELLKFIVAALLRYADTWRHPDEEGQEAALEFFRLFSDIEDRRGLLKPIDHNKPSLVICVHPGGHIVTFRRTGDTIVETENVEAAVTELHKATHPKTHQMLTRVAKAYGLRSIPKTVEQLASDALNEIGDSIDEDEQGYTMNEYGIVPKTTRTDGKQR